MPCNILLQLTKMQRVKDLQGNNSQSIGVWSNMVVQNDYQNKIINEEGLN